MNSITGIKDLDGIVDEYVKGDKYNKMFNKVINEIEECCDVTLENKKSRIVVYNKEGTMPRKITTYYYYEDIRCLNYDTYSPLDLLRDTECYIHDQTIYNEIGYNGVYIDEGDGERGVYTIQREAAYHHFLFCLYCHHDNDVLNGYDERVPYHGFCENCHKSVG